ncbi:MAG: phage virion morphogenesis protein [Halothiobacillus sp.]
MIQIEIDDQQVKNALRRLEKQTSNLKPAFQDIGEYLIVSTKQRFIDSVGPDGTSWAENSPATLARKKGTKPLIDETKRLSTEFSYQASADQLLFGTSLEYGAVQQFGAVKGAFGETTTGHPIPWGDIPARPFIGISDTDETEILDIITSYLGNLTA